MKLSLTHLPILALDCQTTGSSPETGTILEIGWAIMRGIDEDLSPRIESYLLALPEGAVLPRRVSAVTGITTKDLWDAHPSGEIWGRLYENALEVSAAAGLHLCPVVSHYSRFEEPFLSRLHRDHASGIPFPFTLICTHEIAKRLLPDLPRRGLRAVAGYFGHSLGEMRRSAEHVSATMHTWKKLAGLLESECGVRTLDDLQKWLAETPGCRRTGRKYPMERNLRLRLPDQPGVYRMLRTNGDVLYVGKADSLKRRVNSYFQKRSNHAEHILEMLSQARNLEVTITGSALEAALLESDEIKRLSPQYNISLRPRARTLEFCSPDLRDFSVAVDDSHPVGPLPSREPRSFSIIMGLLNGDANLNPDNSMMTEVLHIPEAFAPGKDCFVQGFELFSGKHAKFLKNRCPIGALLTLGARLWRDRAEKNGNIAEPSEAAAEQPEENDTSGHTADAGEWTPDAVAAALEGIILRSAWLMRRARWFAILSESALKWGEHRAGGQETHRVFIERGAIVNRENASKRPGIPGPPAVRISFRDKQRCFDLPAYDRMRVLTTEIRRILVRGGEITVFPAPEAQLSAEKLRKTLSWI